MAGPFLNFRIRFTSVKNMYIYEVAYRKSASFALDLPNADLTEKYLTVKADVL